MASDENSLHPNDEAPAGNRDYEVGYKKPPPDFQFRKGQSGNPKGRPKGVNNFKTDLAAELNERVRITEGGEEKVLTKQQVLIKRATEKGSKGDMRAIEVVFKWRGLYLEEDAADETPVPLSLDDQAIIDQAFATWAETPHPTRKQEIAHEHPE